MRGEYELVVAPSGLETYLPYDRMDVEIPTFDDPITQKSDTAVVTIAAGEHAYACRGITHPSVVAYAEKIGADLIALCGDKCRHWSMGNKYRVTPIARQYERTLYLDTDIVVRPDAPNLFDQVPVDTIGVFDELEATRTEGNEHWAQGQSEFVGASQVYPYYHLPWSFNAGLMVMSKESAYLYDPPSLPMPNLWCADQQLLTLNFLHHKVEPYFLDCRFNLQFNTPMFHQYLDEAFFVHTNGITGKPRIRLLEYLMQRVFYDQL